MTVDELRDWLVAAQTDWEQRGIDNELGPFGLQPVLVDTYDRDKRYTGFGPAEPLLDLSLGVLLLPPEPK